MQKLWKNVLDNPNDDKYRTVRPANKKIREIVTRFYNGTSLLKLVGFQEQFDAELKESVLRIPKHASISFMKG